MTTIRRALPEDREELQRLMKMYIVDFYERPEPPAERLRDLLDMLYEGQRGVQFVAESAGKLLGFVTLYFTYSTLRAQKTAIMNDLFVVEAARGTDAAKGLFEAARAYTREHGYAGMSWETAHDNARAQRFYEKMGGAKGDWLSYSI